MAQYQTNRASCGPASLVNALAALGITRTEDELIQLSGQNVNGTSPRGLRKAMAAIGGLINVHLYYKSHDMALLSLRYWVADRGRPVILCVDEHDHYIAATGYIGERFICVDSAANGLVFYYSPGELVARWVGPRGGYYGLVV